MNAGPHFTDAEYLLDGFEHVETVADFKQRLSAGRPLRVKLGIDPTSPDLHLGFMSCWKSCSVSRKPGTRSR